MLILVNMKESLSQLLSRLEQFLFLSKLGRILSKFLMVLGLIFIVLFVFAALSNESPKTINELSPSPALSSIPSPIATPVESPTPAASRIVRTIGGEGFLRLPNTDDPEQVLFLAPTPKIYNDVSGMFLAKDFSLGAMRELAAKGVFGVSNGSRIRVLDTTFTLTRVRILEGIRPIDSDKVGLSGWLPYEWVVDR